MTAGAADRGAGPRPETGATHALPLVAPALASWAAAIVLLGCSAAAGAVTAVVAAVAAATCWAALMSRPPGARLRTSPRARTPGIRHRARNMRSPGARNVVVGTLACLSATAAIVAFKVHAVTSGPVPGLAARSASVTADVVITDDPRVRPHRGGVVQRDSAVVEARMVSVTSATERFAVDVPIVLFGSGEGWSTLLPSQKVRVRGRLGPAEAGELTAAVLLVRGGPELLGDPSAAQTVAGEVRAGLREASDVLPPGQRGLLPGLVVGDVSRMDDQIRQDFTTAGLSHLTAVSGANLALIAGAVLALARIAGLPLPLRALLMIVAMLGFAVVARPSPSVLRALVMGSIAAVALGAGRPKDGVAVLSATVLGLILFDPGLARQYGFALSVFATGGILVLAPRWRERLAERMPMLAAEAVAVPAAAQAAVTPVLVLMSGRLDLVAVPANLLAGPAVAPATVLGFAAAVVAPLSMGAAQILVHPAGWAAGWIIVVAEHAAAVPMATIGWPGGLAGLVLLAAAAVTVWAVMRRRAYRRAALALLAGALVAVLVAGPVSSPWPPPGWLLVACDVGQGDALAVSAGPGRAIVIDTGPEPGPVDRCLRDLDVRQVPLMVLTHPHLDHVGGLEGAMRGRAVGAALVSPGRVPERESARVSWRLRARGVPEWVMPPGTRWRFGGAEITVIAPSSDAPRQGPGEGAVANNASIVLLVRWFAPAGGLIGSALLAGDLETESQALLARAGVPSVDVLKVPHHGSRRQDPGFLGATRARAALISVGAVNDYGHPAPLTTQRLGLLGMRVYRTDLSGDLAVTAQEGRLGIVPRKG
ncbi:ComEC/Rec2 family competence protein [Planotetraspora phitsanulokensis]|uniref:ComEC/Rec2 family competence protein n=1 Tax=Planotetraspora phitsanulokensis TaxID=575192 RepID=UPI0019514BCB|nr:ComEC/Rec2 family competence protein [Planotetraspora phitsanulokensis]